MNRMLNSLSTKLPWLPGLSAIMAFISCKGTVLLIALFPLLGFTLSIDNDIQAALISIFALLTPTLILYSHVKCQNSRAPIVLSSVAALMVVGTMYIHFNVLVESIGLVLLLASSGWSWVKTKRPIKAVHLA